MLRWIWKVNARKERQDQQENAESARYKVDLLEAEKSSASAGICMPGHFDRSAVGSSGPALRRAIDFFIASSPNEDFLDPWAINRSLLVYLRGVYPVPAVLTVGWYAVGGRPIMEHSFEAAERAVHGHQSLRQGTVHAWVTTRAFEIIDVCMPTLLNSGPRPASVRDISVIFPSPAADDLVVYHPTAVVEELQCLKQERPHTERSFTLHNANEKVTRA